MSTLGAGVSQSVIRTLRAQDAQLAAKEVMADAVEKRERERERGRERERKRERERERERKVGWKNHDLRPSTSKKVLLEVTGGRPPPPPPPPPPVGLLLGRQLWGVNV
jgi:hypothetical protein